MEKITLMREAQAKASRLKSVRALAGLSRKQIELQFGISENTQRMWETPRIGYGGLSERGATKMVELLKKSNVICSIEWLLRGYGEAPKTYENVVSQIIKPLQNLIQVPAVSWGEDELIQEEVKFFMQNNPNPIILQLNDDGMLPAFNVSDYLAGNKVFGNAITKLAGKICIVETQDHLTLCRHLNLGKQDGTFSLSCTNTFTTANHAFLHDVTLLSAAQVVWIRKRTLHPLDHKL